MNVVSTPGPHADARCAAERTTASDQPAVGSQDRRGESTAESGVCDAWRCDEVETHDRVPERGDVTGPRPPANRGR
jgi:hypothetical protein